MAVEYKPVIWNRQKRIYDRILLGGILVYLALFAILQLVRFPQITPETLIIRATGTLAFLMLHFILMIGPLTRLDGRLMPLLYNRRHFGVAMFGISLIHGVFNLIQFHSLGNVNLFVSLFLSNTHYGSFANFPFEVLGFFALLILFLMAATSHDFWLNNLGPKVWKTLHMLVYVAYFLLVMHVMLGVIQLEQSPVLIGLVGFGMVSVTGLHLAAGMLEKRRTLRPEDPAADGFVLVGPVDDIPENRARVILAGEENIAVFRYDGKISAVSNLCRHQNGPLGEGKIVDGCITCPWHGYQYLPHNGQSPPPFTEKLETYSVRLMDGQVWVNPRPFPPGTECPPAVIPNSR